MGKKGNKPKGPEHPTDCYCDECTGIATSIPKSQRAGSSRGGSRARARLDEAARRSGQTTLHQFRSTRGAADRIARIADSSNGGAAAKDWGRIQSINKAKAKAKAAKAEAAGKVQDGGTISDGESGTSRDIPRKRTAEPEAGPAKQPRDNMMEEDDNQEMMEDEQGDLVIQKAGGMGSGGAGNGGVQSHAIIRHLRDKKLVFIMEHRHIYQFRNRQSEIWAHTAAATNAQGYSSIASDYDAVATHLIGFYMDMYDLQKIQNPAFRAIYIKKAEWEIENVQVLQNTLLGGTDLHYANYNGIDPFVYMPQDKQVAYPYHRWDETTRNGVHSVLSTAKYQPTKPFAVTFGLIDSGQSSNNTYLGNNISSNRRIWPLKYLDYRSATTLEGYGTECATWDFGINLNDHCVKFNETLQSYNAASHMPTTGVKINYSDRENLLDVVPDVRDQYGAAPPQVARFAETDSEYAAAYRKFLTYPVGPTYGTTYKGHCSGPSPYIGQGGNQPFMMALQDLSKPDGTLQDYDVVVHMKSRMIVEVETNANRVDFRPVMGHFGTSKAHSNPVDRISGVHECTLGAVANSLQVANTLDFMLNTQNITVGQIGMVTQLGPHPTGNDALFVNYNTGFEKSDDVPAKKKK